MPNQTASIPWPPPTRVIDAMLDHDAVATPPSLGLADSSVVRTLRPGQPGTARWLAQYGDGLVCVRYREDARHARRFVTVELVMEQRPIRATTANGRKDRHHHLTVSVRILPHERQHRLRAKTAGARWNPQTLLWQMPQHVAHSLGLRDRIVAE